MRRLPILLAFVPALALATTPVALPHQGYLLNASDTAVNATGQAFGFSLWSLSASGTQQWPASGESACTVDVRGGYYSVLLDGASSGCGAGLTAEDLAAPGEHWLQISVNGVTLAPRVRVSVTPVAAVASALATTLGVAGGGTGGTTAAQARTNLAAAASGANADITSITGLTTMLSLSQGGTGANLSATGGAGHFVQQPVAGGAFTVAPLSGVDLPSGIDAAKVGTGSVTNQEFSYVHGVTSPIQGQLATRAASGANTDITSLGGLTTAISVAQGGTGATSLTPNGVLVSGSTSTGAASAVATATPGLVLTSNAGAAPSWQSPSAAVVSKANIDAALSSATDALRLPTGTSAQRPSSPANGDLRYNTTTSQLEGYLGGVWVSLARKSPTYTTLTSGTGLTYTPPTGATLLIVRMVGGGGAGGGDTTAISGAGGQTSFGGWTAPGGGGGGGIANWTAGAGGSGGAAGGTGTLIVRVNGSAGMAGNGNPYESVGGPSPFGGAGIGPTGPGVLVGASAAANSGSGGGGYRAATSAAGAGGAGQYVEFSIPAASYTYTVGAGGTPASNGSTGGSGVIIVREEY